jgi:hypothetical protein
MNKILIIIVICIINFNLFSQISTLNIANKKENIELKFYDSLSNDVRNYPNLLVGQELYLNGLEKELKKFGYPHFMIKPNNNTLNDKFNVYKCCSPIYYSNYDSLVGKYFKVLEVIKGEKINFFTKEREDYCDYWFLKLINKENKDTLYYKYYSFDFPFIITGYYEKLKKTLIGKEYTLRGKNWMNNGIYDIFTGMPVSQFTSGSNWKCVDLIITNENYELTLVLENSLGEKIPLNYEFTKNSKWIFEKSIADNYRKKFGKEKWEMILRGSVDLGWNKEMCKLALGNPKDINETLRQGYLSEQWIFIDVNKYSSDVYHYLYFENGVLTSIQW